MILKALELQGFKSFPDKTILTFGPGMTSVVGPNGSGKSNISDAVRWVLGEQSTKVFVVLNGGCNFWWHITKKAQGYAQVTLRMDNTDRLLPKDEDEIAVTRRYYRSGESEYKINGETARLRIFTKCLWIQGLEEMGIPS